MGMDFVALMKHRGPDEEVLRVLDRLETTSPEEVQTLVRLLQARGFSYPRDDGPAWEFIHRDELRHPRLAQRPALPNLGVTLYLPEGFCLTFGPDAVEVYHLLRWLVFLTEPDLQHAMLDACQCLGRLFGAVDCVVTSDYSPVVQAFREGAGFDASLASAGPEDGERPALTDLYQRIPQDYLMREVIDRSGRARTRYRDWDTDLPPPEGWERAYTWDSHGYWRMPLDPARPSPSLAGTPPSARRLLVPGPMDESRWLASGDPAEMLDHLLRRDGVSWRKVRLWGCACVRRLWPRLVTEPTRRVVEVVERFVDGQANQQEVDRAAGAVARVKRGNRRANHAACLVGRLCLDGHRFPPADVGDAVADVMAGGDRDSPVWALEKRHQAALLRCVFGNSFASPPRVDSAWLSWRDGLVRRIAEGIYNDRAFERMGILADALIDAGCDNDEVVAHCREQGSVHHRGCRVIDLLLKKS
jgi:hypothetical protein